MALDPSIYNTLQAPPSPLSILGQVQKARAQDLDLQNAQMEQQQRQQALKAQQTLDQVMKTSLNPDGTINQDAIRTGIVGANLGHLWPQYQKTFDEMDEAHAKLAKANSDAVIAKQNAVAAGIQAVVRANYEPGAAIGAIGAFTRNKVMDPQDALRLTAQIQANPTPDYVKSLVDSLIAQSPQQAEIENARMTANARQVGAQTGAAKLLAEMPGIQADTAVKQQVAAGTQGGITPEQQARLAAERQRLTLEGQQKAISAGQLAVAQQREKRESAQDVGVKLTPQGLDIAAENFAKTGQLPPMGMGKQGAAVRSAIINRAAELHPDLDLASARAGFSADQGSLKQLQKQRDAISSFEQTASKNIDTFLQTAGKVVDTGSPLANALARGISGKVLGSPDQAAYEAARQVALNEIAKITSNPNLSGALSDSARHEVEAFNPNSATLKQTVAVMRILKSDMANRAGAMDEQIAAIKGRISGKAGAVSAATLQKPIPGIPGALAESTDGGKTWKRIK